MNHRTHTSRRPRGLRNPRGITLVEMMVALAITSFVILVVNQLFNSVIATVTRGTQAGELLQKSRTLDEQLAFESELQINSDATIAGNWLSRMVGPAGRDGTAATPGGSPGGFLVIVQRTVQAPLTLEDGLKDPSDLTRLTPIRSDQLMFIYDQKSGLDAPDARRMPAMAPSSTRSFTGDERNSINAEYVRMWYGHVLQIREGDQAANFPPGNISQIDLGVRSSGNPNLLAQDWVLGRQALFLMDDVAPTPPLIPDGIYANGVLPFSGIAGPGGVGQLWNGMTDVSITRLVDITGDPNNVLGFPVTNAAGYQQTILSLAPTLFPLLTSAKSNPDLMLSADYAPAHTYFMGGVSDFIVEFAGDLVNDHFSGPLDPTLIGADGELDRDGQGRIKWYTALDANPEVSGYDTDRPITYPVPRPADYPPYNNMGLPRADAAFVWQHEGSAGFTQWPWMIRIRYRLHDRRGAFEGREIINSSGNAELEPGQWYETIIPVNFQGVK